MAIDPPSSTDFLRQLEHRHKASLTNISQSAQGKIERTIQTLVREIAPVTDKQRQVLLSQYKSAGSDATIKQLLQSPQLKLIGLDVVSKNADTSTLLTLSDQNWRVGDKLTLLNINNQWHVANNEANKSNSSQPSPEKITANIINQLSASVRSALPQQQPLSNLLKLANALNLSGALKANDGKANGFSLDSNAGVNSKPTNLFQTRTRELLQTLLTESKSPQQLESPTLLKQAINNNGTLFENKLNQLLESTQLTATAQRLSGATASSTTNTNKLAAAVLNQLLQGQSNNQVLSTPQYSRSLLNSLSELAREPRGNTQNSKTTQGQQPIINSNKAAGSSSAIDLPQSQNLSKDSKSLLLQLKSALEKEAGITPLPLSNHVSAAGAMQRAQAQSNVDKLITNLLLSANQKNATKESSNVNKETLTATVYRQILASIARIQLQQANSLANLINPAEANPTTQQLHLDIPIKLNEHYVNLEILLEEDWIEKPSDDENEEERKRARQWSVTLAFDLLEAGGFYSRVKVIDDHVSVHFWADQTSTLTSAKKRMEELQAELQQKGVMVDEIQCLSGEPPQRKMQLDYSLVDIRT